MSKAKILRFIVVCFLFLLSFLCAYLVFKPWHTRVSARAMTAETAENWLSLHAIAQEQEPIVNADSATDAIQQPVPYCELLAAMQAYNEKIFAEGQSGLCDPWSYTVPAIDLSAYGLDADEAIGVLQIPSIDISLPIYSGASSAHLGKGAALLSQTSFPIGGENTNSVIGAHRGWNAEDYLRDIEEVRLGDEIIVMNFWGELHYTVSEIKIIEPDDIEQILIRPGRELLTVFTCHPYASGGRYRYLLICDRVTEEADGENATPIATELQADATEQTATPTEAHEEITPTVSIEGGKFESAATEIRLVALVPWIGLTILALLLIAVIAVLLRKKRKNGKSRKVN